MGMPNTLKPTEAISYMAKILYYGDAIMSKRKSQCMALALVGVIKVFLGGLLFATVIDDTFDIPKHPDYNFWRSSIWKAWAYMADPGSHAELWLTKQRVVSAAISIGGIIYFAAILGVVCDIITERMTELRKGKSKVVEYGHTVIFGWNDKAILLIQEICIANESEGGGCIVVLADVNRDTMQIELDTALPKKSRMGTRVVFRTGSPCLISDLVKVSSSRARSVISLASTGEADESDSTTLRCMLSLRSLAGGICGHVVAEVRDVDNEPIVKLVGGDMVDTIVSHDLLGRLMVMSVRQPGLSKVYEAMLGFDGDEFYIQEWEEFVGVAFQNLFERLPDAVPIGIRYADGSLELMPSFDQVIEPGDEIIVIAEDNDSYFPAAPVEISDSGTAPPVQEVVKNKEKVLFCGWRRDLRDILVFMDSIVEPGSEVHIMTHFIPIAKRTAQLMEEGLDIDSLKNIILVHHQGNTSVRKKLEALPFDTYASCMIFADQEYEADTMHADSHSLATLLLCRDIQVLEKVQDRFGDQRRDIDGESSETPDALTMEHRRTESTIEKARSLPITCEILDPRTQKTIAGNKHVALSSEFCQTNKLVAQIVSMIAEERSVKTLIDELLGPDGATVEVAPAGRYCAENEALSFFAVTKRALAFDEIPIGYQLRNSLDSTVLNPPDKDVARVWGKYDFAILKADPVTRLISPEARRAKASCDLSSVQVDLDAAERRRQIRESSKDRDSVDYDYEIATRYIENGETMKEELSMSSEERLGREGVAHKPRVDAPRARYTEDDYTKHPIELAKTIGPFRELQQEMSSSEWKRIGTALGALQQVLEASVDAVQTEAVAGMAKVSV